MTVSLSRSIKWVGPEPSGSATGSKGPGFLWFPAKGFQRAVCAEESDIRTQYQEPLIDQGGELVRRFGILAVIVALASVSSVPYPKTHMQCCSKVLKIEHEWQAWANCGSCLTLRDSGGNLYMFVDVAPGFDFTSRSSCANIICRRDWIHLQDLWSNSFYFLFFLLNFSFAYAYPTMAVKLEDPPVIIKQVRGRYERIVLKSSENNPSFLAIQRMFPVGGAEFSAG